MGEPGDLTADDIIHGDNADHAGDVDSPERLLEGCLKDGPVRKGDLLKSAKEAGFAFPTLERAAKKLGVVRSLLKQDHTPRNSWPVAWRLSDVSVKDSDSWRSGSSRIRFDAPEPPDLSITLKICAESACCLRSAARPPGRAAR